MCEAVALQDLTAEFHDIYGAKGSQFKFNTFCRSMIMV